MSPAARGLDPAALAYLELLRLTLVDFHRIGPDDATVFPSGRVPDTLAQRRAARAEGLDWPRHADTMIGLKRLEQFQHAITAAVLDNVPGDVVETGVWRGGACILARAVLRTLGVTDRRVWLADSFQGLPPPRPDLYPADAGDRHHAVDFLRVDLPAVQARFAAYGLLDDQVRFLPGWFADTLPVAPIERIAVLRLDGDMYESTWVALNSLYDRVSPGGFVIIDDYGAVAGCRKAVDDFRAARGITAPLETIDWTGRWWRVPSRLHDFGLVLLNRCRAEEGTPPAAAGDLDIWPGPANPESGRLAEAAQTALAKGERAQARQLAQAALTHDPNCLPAHLALSAARMPGPDYLAMLAELHHRLRPGLYVEIGVFKGASLQLARPDCRVLAIDPRPMLPTPPGPDVTLLEMTSGSFFSEGWADRLLGGRGFDLAFIDGLHRFEQALRDFMCLERFARPGAAVVLHDTIPLDARVSERERRTTFYTGDVWKVVAVLRLLRPDLSVRTLAAGPSGLTVITGLDPQSSMLWQHYDRIVAHFAPLTFSYLSSQQDILLDMADSVEAALAPASGMAEAEQPDPGIMAAPPPRRFLGAAGFTPPLHGCVITGWIALPADQPKGNITIIMDGQPAGETMAATWLGEIAVGNRPCRKWGFEWAAPMTAFDGQSHAVELRDTASGTPLARASLRLEPAKTYHDVESFLNWLYFFRIVASPFNETDRLCLAALDMQADHLFARLEADRTQNDRPLVTVIMPTHNGSAWLLRAIGSVLEQSHGHLELIVIDDGSTDQTRALLATVDDPRLRILRLDHNLGPAAARNLGLLHSRGEYIAYLDDDNFWDRRYLSLMIDTLRRQPDHDLIYCGQWLVRDGHSDPFAARLGPFNASLLDNQNYIDLNAVVHRATLVRRYGMFGLGLHPLEDWDLIRRYTRRHAPFFLPCTLSWYTVHPSDKSHWRRTGVGRMAWRRITDRRLSDAPFDFIDGIPVRDGTGEASTRHYTFSSNTVLGATERQIDPVSIIIPSYNVPELLLRCVESVLRTVDPRRTELIICDNGSEPPTRQLIEALARKYPQIRTDFWPHNAGFTHAVNRGLKLAAPGNPVVLLNNDAIVTEGWLYALNKTVHTHRDIGIVAPQQVLLPGTPTILAHAPCANIHHEIDVNVSVHHRNLLSPDRFGPEKLVEVNSVPFFCVLLSRAVIDTLGPLPELLGRHYRSDFLYCDAVRRIAGKRIVCTWYAKVYHLLQQSTHDLRALNPDLHRIMLEKNGWDDMAARQADLPSYLRP